MPTDPDYYALFLNALRGLIDDAELSNYDADGAEHLREALAFFESDYRIRTQSNPDGSSTP